MIPADSAVASHLLFSQWTVVIALILYTSLFYYISRRAFSVGHTSVSIPLRYIVIISSITSLLSMWYIPAYNSVIPLGVRLFFIILLVIETLAFTVYYASITAFKDFCILLFCFLYCYLSLYSATLTLALTVNFFLPHCFWLLFILIKPHLSSRIFHIIVSLSSIIVFVLRVVLHYPTIYPQFPSTFDFQHLEQITLLYVPQLILLYGISLKLFIVLVLYSVIVATLLKVLYTWYRRLYVKRSADAALEETSLISDEEDELWSDQMDEQDVDDDIAVDSQEAQITYEESRKPLMHPPSTFVRYLNYVCMFMAGPCARMFVILDCPE
ncbi:hypothetical protein GEMRC1_005679 [Eukaryota sp. GEM-RC1]